MVPTPNILLSNQVCLMVLFSVPSYFLFTSMISKAILNQTNFLSDDTMLFSIVKDPGISANELNHDLDIIHTWAHQ